MGECEHRFFGLVGLLICCSLTLTHVCLAQAAHPIQKDLDGLGKNLARERRLLRRLQQQSSSLLQTLGELDGDLELAEKEHTQALAQKARLEEEQAALRKQHEVASRSLDEVQARLKIRLRRLYKDGQLGWLNLLFGAGTFSEGLQRAGLLRLLASQDQRLIAETRRTRAFLEKSEHRIGIQQKELEQVAAEVVERRARAKTAKAEKVQALDLLSKKKALHTRAMRELKRSRGRLVKLVATIGGGSTKGKGFATWRGRLPSPVAKARVEVGFGRQVDKRFKTVTEHQGVDLRAAKGTPVKAVYPGTVAFAGPFRGYGLLVILQHGGGYYTLYGHLTGLKVRKGKKVRQGQEVGARGDTGSLKGAYLYFEIRRGGQAVDPALWVRRWRRWGTLVH